MHYTTSQLGIHFPHPTQGLGIDPRFGGEYWLIHASRWAPIFSFGVDRGNQAKIKEAYGILPVQFC